MLRPENDFYGRKDLNNFLSIFCDNLVLLELQGTCMCGITFIFLIRELGSIGN